MTDQPTIRVFISSPADVRPERLRAEQVVARLDREFTYRFHVEAVLWEREPLVATHHFQDPENIPQPRTCDIVVVILWSRLGLVLPSDRFRGAISGGPVTGTEWEFEDALASARERGMPELLLYRKTATSIAELDSRAAVQQRLDQLDRVETFIGRWFRADSGPGYTAASHSFRTTGEFEEQLYEHLHALLERRAGARVEGVAIRWHEAPYRGLLSFEYEQAPVFFGRNRSRNELRELLARQIDRGRAFLLVFGASGAGKSSLVKAGLLPDLSLPGMIGRVALVRRALLRPSDAGGDPLAALAAAMMSATALPELSELEYTPETLAALLRDAPGQAALPIRQGLAAAGKAAQPPLTNIAEARLNVVVDQLEELFTMERIAQPAREAFVAALEALARSGLVWVVATMRSDFFDRLETLPALAALSAEARFLLLPPDPAEIGQIIRQPALEAGLRFEVDMHGVGLEKRIRQAAASERGALPLLSFLLDQLWQQRSEEGLLTFAAYGELGGLAGAIGRRAEGVFRAQPEAARKELAPLLRELVTIEGGKPVSRAAPLSRFPQGSPSRQLLDALLAPAARLLVAETPSPAVRESEMSGAASGAPEVRLAHEALLTDWTRARDEITADARDLELRARLEQEAARWRAAPRREKKGRVIGGLFLTEARSLVSRWGAELPGELTDFVSASRRADLLDLFGFSRKRWMLSLYFLLGSVAVVLVVGAAAVAAWAVSVWWGVRQVEAEWAAKGEFVRVPAGCFEMGSRDIEQGRYPDEGPVHQVCLEAFDLAKFTVTQGEWRRVMVGFWGIPDNPDPSGFKGDGRRPVENVSWKDAQAFAQRMRFFSSSQYRLSSESEYEYAARAGTTTSRYWGENIDDGCAYENIADQSMKADVILKKVAPESIPAFANCDDGFGYTTAPVGSFKPNPWGLDDMLGNVLTWTEDCYVDNYRATPRDGGPNTSGPCALRVIRGSSWYNVPPVVRAARRFGVARDAVSTNIGLRLARTIRP